jgi:hypothetical protein
MDFKAAFQKKKEESDKQADKDAYDILLNYLGTIMYGTLFHTLPHLETH